MEDYRPQIEPLRHHKGGSSELLLGRDSRRHEKRVIATQNEIPLRDVKLPSRQALNKGQGLPSDVLLQPGVNLRKKGTLQRGNCRITSRSWRYDGKPFALAVICRRMWAPTAIS